MLNIEHEDMKEEFFGAIGEGVLNCWSYTLGSLADVCDHFFNDAVEDNGLGRLQTE